MIFVKDDNVHHWHPKHSDAENPPSRDGLKNVQSCGKEPPAAATGLANGVQLILNPENQLCSGSENRVGRAHVQGFSWFTDSRYLENHVREAGDPAVAL